ncbi:aldehyde dehydrogenase family protein [Paremcibacter congregatus]|uniref:Betaine-aldehyde dehydrogenase n=1 Tax=Paremcibacter congregatus TaxID=2043170 RepID=A0A2G4YQT9_9PROT|nr:aldehyde dehydrogenase family protein [Paremcibacter congregatus]PHZ84685.1 betaine-aldehyde dehydrogenase [Paremcibacter congregatus]QDE28879.1 aldehyde dehydrogenase family protein [Paremcibacter congregatus]
MTPTSTALKQIQTFLATEKKMLLNGQWCAGQKGEILPAINPATEDIIGRFYAGGTGDVQVAIEAAHNSFHDKRWRNKTPAEKARILWRLADLIEEHGDRLALLETLDGGKPYQAARQGEIPMAAESFRYYAGWCTKISGRTSDISIPGDFHCYSRREPAGVVGLITPWNGPLVMAAWKMAPALAAGCSVILKPSEVTSLSTLYLAELIVEAGIPDGVVNIVPGPGATVGAALVNSPLVHKVSFTGSTQTGKSLVQAAMGNLKKLTLELGGKSPVIVYKDADLAKAIPGIADGIFGNAGQVCVAGSRLFAAPEIYDDLLSGLIDYAQNITVGDGVNPETTMGPLISEEHRARVTGYVAKGLAQGATLATGGIALDRKGYFMTPTILTDVTPGNCVAAEEIFGPVLSVMKTDHMDHVIAAANATDFGLAGSVWTRDISTAHKTVADIRAGLMWINCHGIPDMAIPFGGYNQSGWGREGGPEGIEYYTELKSVVTAL